MRFLSATRVFLLTALSGFAGELPTWQVPRLAGEVQVDGVLREPQYREALRWDGFVEVMPRENLPSQWPTELYVFSTPEGLMVGLRCVDPEPRHMKLERFRRDEVANTDSLYVGLDPTGEAKQAVFVLITPRNDVGDGLYDMTRGTTSSSFDFLFKHGARLTDSGWEAEVFIPFSSLSFRPGKESLMLLTVQRYLPREDFYVLNAVPYDRTSEDPRNGAVQLVVDSSGVDPARRWHLIPAWVGSRLRQQGLMTDTSAAGSLGVTGEWQPRQDTLLKATWRPDFSQVEADDTYQKVNNRYPVFIREKRPFFLEGAESFATPLRLFYSRKIVQPEWGLKLSHRGERLGLFAVLAEEQAVPAERFGLVGQEQRARWGVFRGTWALDSLGSFVGATITLRNFGGSSTNRVFAFDATKQGEKLTGTFQAAVSQTSTNGRAVSGVAVTANANYRWNEYWRTSIWAEMISPDFRADAGFLPDTDRRRFTLQQEYTYLPKQTAGFLRSVNAAVALNSVRGTGGALKWEGASGYALVTVPHQITFFVNPSFGREGFAGHEFDRIWSVSFGAQWREHKSFQPFASVSKGRELVYGPQPFAGGSQGWEVGLTSARGPWSASVMRSRYRFGDGTRAQDSWQVEVTYVFSESWSARVFLVDDALRFADWDLAFRSRFVNALLTYRLNPFSAVYLGANMALEKEGELPRTEWQQTKTEQIFVKLSWYF